MRHTKLGRTGLKVSVIGIGMEHLHGQPRKTVVSVVREAIEHGINYFPGAMADAGMHVALFDGWPMGGVA